MGRNFRAARVFQTAAEATGIPLFPSGGSTGRKVGRANGAPPAWFKAVQMVQPSETLTRPYPIQHSPPDARGRRPRQLYKPTKIVFPEDELRQTFYRDHPWELARPMSLVELYGTDARYRDWSKGVRQPGMQLSGECVVQRQLWLMENQGLNKAQAYDKARREFYSLRQQEDIERRIAVEEARMVGGYFGKSLLQVGVELEDKQFEAWKYWATASIATRNAQAEGAVVVGASEEVEEEEEAVVAE